MEISWHCTSIIRSTDFHYLTFQTFISFLNHLKSLPGPTIGCNKTHVADLTYICPKSSKIVRNVCYTLYIHEKMFYCTQTFDNALPSIILVQAFNTTRPPLRTSCGLCLCSVTVCKIRSPFKGSPVALNLLFIWTLLLIPFLYWLDWRSSQIQ